MSTKVEVARRLSRNSNSSLVIRKAGPRDVAAMYGLINHYAERERMLPKSQLQLYESLRDYSVAVDGDSNVIVGCGALHIYWSDLAELRALAVAPERARDGVGSLLVGRLVNEARDLGIARVFLFTYVAPFFARFQFKEVAHGSIPLKVYNECFHCPKFNACDEVAMELNL